MKATTNGLASKIAPCSLNLQTTLPESFMPPHPSDPGLEITSRGDVLVARFTHEVILSGEVAQAAAARLAALWPAPGQRGLLVDFAKVRSLSSLMLGELVQLNRAVEAAGGRLALFNIGPLVREVFTVTGLDRVLLLYTDEEDALGAL